MSDLSKALSALDALRQPAERVPPVRPAPRSPPPAPAPPALSDEQRAVVDTDARRLDVVALAGTGKTRVLVAYAAARPRARWRYLTFARALADEAAAVLPANVRASTFHALAHPRFGVPLGNKLHQRFNADAVRRAVGWEAFPGWEAAVAALARWREGFLASSAPLPALAQLPAPAWAWLVACPGVLEAIGGTQGFLAAAERFWQATLDPRRTDIDAPGDVPVKLMALAGMEFGADGLLIDEAQDMTPCLAQALAGQKAPCVAVGDPAQALYGWRGAGGWRPAPDARSLRGSWRFGAAVAALANRPLAALGRPERLEGLREDSSLEPVDPATPLRAGTTVIARTQADALAAALEAARQGLSPRWVGRGSLRRLASLVDLAQGRPVHDPWLAGLSGVAEVGRVARAAGALEWRAAARLVATTDPVRLEGLLAQLRAADPGQVAVSTVHQAKGRTFDRVRLAPDLDACFQSPDPDEQRVAYVALTRAAHLELGSAASQALAASPAAPAPAPLACDDGF